MGIPVHGRVIWVHTTDIPEPVPGIEQTKENLCKPETQQGIQVKHRERLMHRNKCKQSSLYQPLKIRDIKTVEKGILEVIYSNMKGFSSLGGNHFTT